MNNNSPSLEEPPDSWKGSRVKREQLEIMVGRVIEGLMKKRDGNSIGPYEEDIKQFREIIRLKVKKSKGKRVLSLVNTECIDHFHYVTSHFFREDGHPLEGQEFPQRLWEYQKGLSPRALTIQGAKRYLESLSKFGQNYVSNRTKLKP